MNFRRVDKIDHGHCTVSLWLWEDKKRGRILRPKKQRVGRIVTELLSQLGDVAAEDALKLAVCFQRTSPIWPSLILSIYGRKSENE